MTPCEQEMRASNAGNVPQPGMTLPNCFPPGKAPSTGGIPIPEKLVAKTSRPFDACFLTSKHIWNSWKVEYRLKPVTSSSSREDRIRVFFFFSGLF